MSMLNIESTTWFDQLPTELIFHIFNYLLNNDIIYTFFFFSQRLNNLLLQNQRYLSCINLPTTNFDIWENIFKIIGCRIESLNINTIDGSFPLKYFTNIKSVTISSSFSFPDEQLKLIFKNDQFNNLHSFKIKEDKIFSDFKYERFIFNQGYIFEKVFNKKSSLRTFQYSLRTRTVLSINKKTFQMNFNLHALTLILNDFEDIFTLISYTPNLKYLNVESSPPYLSRKSINKSNIKLNHLFLKLDGKKPIRYSLNDNPIDFNELMNSIHQFSSSLICLSLNLVDVRIINADCFPFNNVELQQFLESMIELKQFHLYAKLIEYSIEKDNILSKFQDQYWFNHNLSFAMHEDYFYTLPFHFDYLKEFYHGFDNIKSNNPKILINNPQIWYNVKSIELLESYIDDRNFINELKIKMPKLKLIKLSECNFSNLNQIKNIHINGNKKNYMDLTLNHVKTINFISTNVENEKYWLRYIIPNLRHLALSYNTLINIYDRYGEILNEKIERLDINASSDVHQLTEINHLYFSNVKYINFWFNDDQKKYQWCVDILIKILKNFKNLKTLTIYIHSLNLFPKNQLSSEINNNLDINEIMKTYQVKYFQDYCLFIKKLL